MSDQSPVTDRSVGLPTAAWPGQGFGDYRQKTQAAEREIARTAKKKKRRPDLEPADFGIGDRLIVTIENYGSGYQIHGRAVVADSYTIKLPKGRYRSDLDAVIVQITDVIGDTATDLVGHLLALDYQRHYYGFGKTCRLSVMDEAEYVAEKERRG